MKVDRNQLVPNIEINEESVGAFGVPLRLEIAARIFGSPEGFAPVPAEHSATWTIEPAMRKHCHFALLCADALIEAHNETCGDE